MNWSKLKAVGGQEPKDECRTAERPEPPLADRRAPTGGRDDPMTAAIELGRL